ncbi:MCE family protein [Mycobacterium sp. AZCC_0083]|uniref:MCE family protein n=1 Tax=Mycobacterium sp. AZCC_0083 TaxID=2735882 RepID=UPI001621EC01|nr:MlaD family protein [Mycobacterium sp. AZCC_0083]MBB5166423.1 virulence factor Mce-like protein [Mycobacterium sp. AZCC_0083]
MLTRFVRNQLIIFTIASVVAVALMVFSYMQVPTLVGLGRMTVKLELPATGALYRFSNVTYRGVQVGRVTSVDLTDDGVEAMLSLDKSSKIPADLHAAVRSLSAVGEQYLDLLPRNDSPPYLHDGSIIAASDTTLPQAVGPMLDQVSALVASIPKDTLGDMLDESFTAFNGAGDDFGSLLDSGATVTRDANATSDNVRALVDDSGPLLDSQAETADSIRTWAHSLAGVTDQVVIDDPQVRTLLQKGPAFAQETSRLLNQIKPTLPVLLANLTTIGQIAVTYNPSLEQLFVLLPPYVATVQTYGLGTNNPTGLPLGDFGLTFGDPPACTVGFLPPSQWRSPAETNTVDTPDGLYCKLPQDSPIAVRGARNYPCMGHPGKRAPTVQICDSDKPFEPLAMREHALGAYPFDPNLVAQGVPPDSRATLNDNIYGPLEGNPMPAQGPAPGLAPTPAGDLPPQQAPESTVGQDDPPPAATTPGPSDESIPSAAPSSFTGGSDGSPAVAVVQYNPRTGKYVAPDGRQFQQSDLVTSSTTPQTWKDLLPI